MSSTILFDGVDYRIDQETYPQGMVVLEVPYEQPPRAWFASDEEHFCRICELRWVGRDLSDYDEFKGHSALAYWSKVNAHTLKHQEIFSISETLDAISLEAFGKEKLLEVLVKRDVLTPLENAK